MAGSAHRRETLPFGRSGNGLVERLALFVVWRNLAQARSKRHHEKNRGAPEGPPFTAYRPPDYGQRIGATRMALFTPGPSLVLTLGVVLWWPTR